MGKLSTYGIASDVISTDDYHRGASWLEQYNSGVEWSEWDHPIVYDTLKMARDIELLQAGQVVPRYEIDFSIAEPVLKGEISPVPVLIIEGIYAGSSDLNNISATRYDVPTPLATCIGRRLKRDLNDRPQFANPKTSLLYMIEQAEPMYRLNNKS